VAGQGQFAEAKKMGFRPIPLDRIGIYADEYRAELKSL